MKTNRALALLTLPSLLLASGITFASPKNVHHTKAKNAEISGTCHESSAEGPEIKGITSKDKCAKLKSGAIWVDSKSKSAKAQEPGNKTKR